MAEVQWYYARDDQPMGPVSAAELKQLVEAGELKPDDLLWREGMEAWTTAVNLRGLFGESGGGADEIAGTAVQSHPPDKAVRPRAPGLPSTRARLQTLLRTTQAVLWAMCVLVVLVGIVLFTRAFLRAETATEEAAAGVVFCTFFIAAYVLARAGEKLSRLLLSYGRRRSK